MPDALLELAGIETAYGRSQVLFGVSFSVGEGEMVTLMGRNGMGKTTTVRSVMGLTPARAGAVRFGGVDITALPSYRIAQLGIGLVPEGRRIFPNLTVRENLVATAAQDTDGWTLDKVYALFPRLAERADSMGNQLSGGEQQMLAIGRALMTNPRLLILDEATEGLAPLIRAEIWRNRQECRDADPHRRPPSPDRARPHRVERFVARARPRARGAAPLPRGLGMMN
jgi:branched-chain amino acid transport system ATP-binding protein